MASEALVVDVSQDWAIACEVQERFMQAPSAGIESLTYSARCRQVRALGGDCYDFFSLPHNRLGLAVGDASGKGLAAALMISNVQSSLRTAASFAANDTAAVLHAVNRQVHASSRADRYATLFFGVFDEATWVLRYANAGHNPPLVIRADGSVVRLEPSGPPVGIFSDSTYEEGEIVLRAGDLIVAYTDGIVEAFNAVDEQWGVQRLLDAVAQSDGRTPDELVDAIFASLNEFSGGDQTDDATVLVARVGAS